MMSSNRVTREVMKLLGLMAALVVPPVIYVLSAISGSTTPAPTGDGRLATNSS